MNAFAPWIGCLFVVAIYGAVRALEPYDRIVTLDRYDLAAYALLCAAAVGVVLV